MSNTDEACVARCAMQMKKRGEEPTYPRLVALCPKATQNSETGEPVDKRAVYNTLRSRCYDDDDDPEDTWSYQARLAKDALTEKQIVARDDFGKWQQSLNHQAAWYFRRVVWTDICNKIIPRTQAKATEQALARKGSKGWTSKKTKLKSKSLRGKRESLKQNSWGTLRVYFAPVLTRGKLYAVYLGENFPGEKPAGAAILVAKVRATLNVHFRTDQKPDLLFTDRGQGFYSLKNGTITSDYQQALQTHGLSTVMGTNAQKQPGDLKDVLLHETAVSWLTHRLTVTLPPKPWEETVPDFLRRLHAACDYVNTHYDVDSLCRAWPERITKLLLNKGDRLSH